MPNLGFTTEDLIKKATQSITGLGQINPFEGATTLASSVSEIVSAPSISNFNSTYTEITTSDINYYGIDNPRTGFVWIRIPDDNLFPTGSSSNLQTAGMGGDSVWKQTPTGDFLAPKNTANTAAAYNDIINSFLQSKTGFLETRPNHFQKFKFQRLSQGIGNFEITLFDNKFQELTYKLKRSRGSIVFKYGYTANEDKASPWILGRVFSYNIQFGLEGVTINLTGMAVGHELATRITWDEDIKTNPISDIVIKLAQKAGLQYIVEPTAIVRSRSSSMETAELLPINLSKIGGDTTLEYVVRQLIPYSQNSKGESNYVFYIEHNKENKPILHYHTLGYLDKSGNSALKIPAFTLFSNPNTPVLDFQPDWNRSLIDLAGATTTYSPIYNLTNQTTQQIFGSSDDDPNSSENSGKLTTTNTVVTNTSCYKVVNDVMYESPEAATTRSKTESEKKKAITISAKLRVIGSPKFQICDPIAVIVYLPRQFTVGIQDSMSNVHEISGLFRIIGITDTIDNGNFVTDLSLATAGKPIIDSIPLSSIPSVTSLPPVVATLVPRIGG